MAAAGFVATSGAAQALAAATAKTILAVVPSTGRTLTVTELSVSFDGVTASAVPVLVELCTSTQATAGTSTGGTISQVRGRPTTVGATSAINYTVEPTVLTATRQWLVTPNGGLYTVQFPLGREPEADATTIKAVALRITAPAIVNVRGYVEFEQE